ncbi:MAG: rhomboid family intramembrane serine protease [Cyclobacteriaceae bacterium]|nr:MAG: rhomboid family intramembrane serine protease [Cyclobacteriaceae bacterium]
MHTDLLKFRSSIIYTMTFVGILWLVRIVESLLSFDLGVLGIHPRSLAGTVGILTGPLVHGDFQHLMSNSLPLIFLGIGVFYFYNRIALEVFLGIYFFTSIWVWIVARDAYHIGASGIVYGLASFLLFSGFFRKDSRSIAISLIVIFIYGGMAYGLFPLNEGISWESHLLGSLAGLLAAFLYRRHQLATKVEYIEAEPYEIHRGDKVTFYDHTWHDANSHINYIYKGNTTDSKDQD